MGSNDTRDLEAFCATVKHSPSKGLIVTMSCDIEIKQSASSYHHISIVTLRLKKAILTILGSIISVVGKATVEIIEPKKRIFLALNITKEKTTFVSSRA